MAGASDPQDEPDDAGAEPANGTRSLKILIVEDEFFIALDTQALVEEMGHAVVGVAVSAEQAVSAAGREKPDVVLMDIRIVGPKDGIDAAAEIRERYGIDSIFVTANTDPATLARAMSINPLGVLQKPLMQSPLQDYLVRIRGRPEPH